MTASKLLGRASLAAALMLMFLQIGLAPAAAGRGCKMGADCKYNAAGHGKTHQARNLNEPKK